MRYFLPFRFGRLGHLFASVILALGFLLSSLLPVSGAHVLPPQQRYWEPDVEIDFRYLPDVIDEGNHNARFIVRYPGEVGDYFVASIPTGGYELVADEGNWIQSGDRLNPVTRTFRVNSGGQLSPGTYQIELWIYQQSGLIDRLPFASTIWEFTVRPANQDDPQATFNLTNNTNNGQYKPGSAVKFNYGGVDPGGLDYVIVEYRDRPMDARDWSGWTRIVNNNPSSRPTTISGTGSRNAPAHGMEFQFRTTASDGQKFNDTLSPILLSWDNTPPIATLIHQTGPFTNDKDHVWLFTAKDDQGNMSRIEWKFEYDNGGGFNPDDEAGWQAMFHQVFAYVCRYLLAGTVPQSARGGKV